MGNDIDMWEIAKICGKWLMCLKIGQNDFYPIMYMHISCVGLCVDGFMNPMPS